MTTHLPIRRAASALVALALALGAQFAATPARADSVLQVQQRTLVGLGYLDPARVSGRLDAPTAAAVRAFQVDRCLDRTSEPGNRTNAQLTAVAKLVQKRVGRLADGTLDQRDQAAVRAWQKAHSLPQTGRADARTMRAMGIARTRPCGSGVRGDITRPSTRFGCAKGTRHLGLHRGYLKGRAVTLRLCAVTGLPSNSAESRPGSRHYVAGAKGDAVVLSQASGAYAGLVLVARNSGRSLSANSSFRTMAHQRELCSIDARCVRGDHTYTMRPGYSNHQLGAAVDFAGTFVKGSCARPAKAPASSTWRFLVRNGSRFGIRQYQPESWHWEVAPSPCR